MFWTEKDISYQKQLKIEELPSEDELLQYKPQIPENSRRFRRLQHRRFHGWQDAAQNLFFGDYLLRIAEKNEMVFSSEEKEALRYALASCNLKRFFDLGPDPFHGKAAGNKKWLTTVFPNLSDNINILEKVSFLNKNHDKHGKKIPKDSEIQKKLSLGTWYLFRDALILESYARLPIHLKSIIPSPRSKLHFSFSREFVPTAVAIHSIGKNDWSRNKESNINRFTSTLASAIRIVRRNLQKVV